MPTPSPRFKEGQVVVVKMEVTSGIKIIGEEEGIALILEVIPIVPQDFSHNILPENFRFGTTIVFPAPKNHESSYMLKPLSIPESFTTQGGYYFTICPVLESKIIRLLK
jgi:hypothetical protein